MFKKNKNKDKIEYKTKEVKILNMFYAKRVALVVSIFLFIMFFFFINNSRMVPEYTIVNAWIKESSVYGEPFSDPTVEIEGEFLLDFFSINNRFIHYFDKNGFSVSYKTLNRNQFASVNNNNYIIYTKFGTEVNSFDKFGRILWSTNTSVYPRAAGFANIISMHTSENSSFTLIDWNNNMLTDGSKRYGEYITDSMFSKETGDFVVGYINGNIAVYYRTGQLAFEVIPIISRINICKGVAITEKGSFVATITGIDNEYLSVYDAFGSLMWNVHTQMDSRKNVYLGMSQYSMTISMLNEDENKLHIYNLVNGTLMNTLDLNKYNIGQIKYMKFDSSSEHILFAFSSSDKSIIILYDTKTNNVIWEQRIDEQTYDINMSTAHNEYLIITKNYMYTFKRIKI